MPSLVLRNGPRYSPALWMTAKGKGTNSVYVAHAIRTYTLTAVNSTQLVDLFSEALGLGDAREVACDYCFCVGTRSFGVFGALRVAGMEDYMVPIFDEALGYEGA